MRTQQQVRSAAANAAKGLLLNRGAGRRATVRKAFFDIARRMTPTVAVEHDGVWYYVSTDDFVGRETFVGSPYDVDKMADALAALERRGYFVRGRTFVDVGANIGTTTLPALTRFGARDVLAVEPEPRNVRLLRCNLIANDLGHRARVVQAAASAADGTAALQRTVGNSGDNRVRLDTVGGNGSTIDVPLRRLDDLLAEHEIDLEEIGVVWMDCQGHEAHVLAGAPKLLESRVPVVVEYWPEGLREAGGADLLHSLIAEHYDHVIDVRDIGNGFERTLPAREVHTLHPRYPEPSFTDLILLKERRPAGSA